jgi:hypothetical protein
MSLRTFAEFRSEHCANVQQGREVHGQHRGCSRRPPVQMVGRTVLLRVLHVITSNQGEFPQKCIPYTDPFDPGVERFPFLTDVLVRRRLPIYSDRRNASECGSRSQSSSAITASTSAPWSSAAPAREPLRFDCRPRTAFHCRVHALRRTTVLVGLNILVSTGSRWSINFSLGVHESARLKVPFRPKPITAYLKPHHDVRISCSGDWCIFLELDIGRLHASQHH